MFHTTKRQSDILHTVKLRGTCQIIDLARDLGVSDETIRRDVRLLADEGMVVKIHGAIVAPDSLRENPFQLRMQENRDAKIRIATMAASLVEHGESIMLDTGSTTAYVAQTLAQHRNLLAITNSIEVARSFANQNGNRVYMAGGEVRADDGAVFGETTNEFASRFLVDKGFLSISAITEETGLMDSELWEADFSRVITRQASQVIVVADHTKFNRRSLVKVCDFDNIDILITTAQPPPAIQEKLDAAGVKIMVA